MLLDGSLEHLTVHGVLCTATCTTPIPTNWMISMLCGGKTQNGSSRNLMPVARVCSKNILEVFTSFEL